MGIHEQAQVLDTHPEIGSRYLPSDRNVCILLHGHYRIAYLLEEDRNVDILVGSPPSAYVGSRVRTAARQRLGWMIGRHSDSSNVPPLNAR